MRKWLVALILLLSLSTKAYAGDWQAIEFFDLTGGLNDGFDSISIANNEAQDLQNVVFTTGGAIKKRQGFTNINQSAISSTADFTGITFYKQADQDRFLVALTSDGATDAIYKMDYTGSGPDGTWDDITGSLSLSFSTDNQGDFTIGQDTLIIEDGNGQTPPYKWSGSGNAEALGGSPPDASMVEYHKNHLFSAGDDSNPSRVTFSQFCNNSTAPGCIENYTATDIIDVETNDGQIVRSIKSALDCLYVFKDRSIWRVCGEERDTFTLEQMVNGIGTLSNSSVVIINNQFLFTTAECDVAVYDGGLNVEIISTKIEGTLETLNFDRCDDTVAVAFDDATGDEDYYVAVSGPGSGENNLVLVYDTYHKAWTKFSGINANAITTYEVGTLQRAIAFGDYSGTANRYPDTNSDDASAINAYWTSGDIRIKEIPSEKIFHQAQVIVDQEGDYNLEFEYTVNFTGSTSQSLSLDTPGAVWDSAIYDSSIYADESTTIQLVDINKTGDFFRWKISNSFASQPVTLKGMRLWVEPTGRLGTL
jgi:hypothetical protein